jgi:hypothetical protein
MQHRLVGLIADGAEDLALDGIGVGKQRQRLVAVAGQDHLVEGLHAGRCARAPQGMRSTADRALQPLMHPPAARSAST